MPPISAFIIAHDEVERIGPALDSLAGVAHEVVVVDSGSTDGTQELARAKGARVIHNDWPGYGQQKRFAEGQCRHRWLLNIDADERLTPALAEEVRGLDLAADGYEVLIRDRFFFEDEPRAGAYAYDPVRLYDREAGSYADETVHDRVTMKEGARIERLAGEIWHDSIPTLRFAIEKMNRYTDLQAQVLAEKGRRIGAGRLALEFPVAFLKAYLGRRYLRYGAYGLILSTHYAYGRFARAAKRYEMQLAERRRR